MKNILWKTICFFIFSFPAIFAQGASSDHELMMEANKAYQDANYQDAISLYHEIVDHGNEGAILFYNLGNAYFKSGSHANALLWYERASRLAPSNEDIKHNIVFTNQFITDKIETMPDFILSRWWNSVSSSMTAKGWAIASIVICYLLFSMIALLLFSRKQWLRAFSFIFSILFFLGFVFAIIFAQRESVRYQKFPEAIIMQSVVTAKSTPNDSGSDLFIIHEGLKVKITDAVNEWSEIRLPNGEKGWVPDQSFEVI